MSLAGHEVPHTATLEKIVSRYIRDYRPISRKEDRHYQRLGSLNEAISQAAMCLDPRGKRHPHQCRIPRDSLEKAKVVLLTSNLDRCADFEQLHNAVEDAISHIYMIGPLTIYDISQRIGAYLGLEPDDVFLHRGTAEGARALGLRPALGRLRISKLPEPFHRLTADEIEDCLCLYKTELTAIYAR